VFVPLALVIFLALPIYFAVTSHGLDALPSFVYKVRVTRPVVPARVDREATWNDDE
jgi:hypothetical protein